MFFQQPLPVGGLEIQQKELNPKNVHVHAGRGRPLFW